MGETDRPESVLMMVPQQKWRFQTQTVGAIGSSPAVGADGTVYVGWCDNYLYAVDGTTGQQLAEPGDAGNAQLRGRNAIAFRLGWVCGHALQLLDGGGEGGGLRGCLLSLHFRLSMLAGQPQPHRFRSRVGHQRTKRRQTK